MQLNPETLATEFDGGVLHITLNRPAARNALSRKMVAELAAIAEHAGADDAVRVIVLRGGGGHFCAGADISDMAAARAGAGGDRHAMAEVNRGFGRMIEAFDANPKTVIAVLEGAVLGGGLGLACAADITLAAADARLGLPETTLGLIPAQIIPFVVDRIGRSESRRLALTGARFDGVEAFRLGLAHVVCEHRAALDSALSETISAALNCAPRACARTKALLLATRDAPAAELLDQGAQAFAEAAGGGEAMEGMRAFMERRPPEWPP